MRRAIQRRGSAAPFTGNSPMRRAWTRSHAPRCRHKYTAIALYDGSEYGAAICHAEQAHKGMQVRVGAFRRTCHARCGTCAYASVVPWDLLSVVQSVISHTITTRDVKSAVFEEAASVEAIFKQYQEENNTIYFEPVPTAGERPHIKAFVSAKPKAFELKREWRDIYAATEPRAPPPPPPTRPAESKREEKKVRCARHALRPFLCLHTGVTRVAFLFVLWVQAGKKGVVDAQRPSTLRGCRVRWPVARCGR